MRRLRVVVMGLLAIVLFLNMCAKMRSFGGHADPAGNEERARQLAQSPSSVEPLFLDEQTIPSLGAEPISSVGYLQTDVTLSAPHSTTSWDERDPARPRYELPLLFLHHQREAAAEADRTLDIHVAGLPAGAEVQIEAQSRHVDVSTGDWHRVAQRFVLPDRPCTSENPCTVRWTFDASSTFSDFYDLRVRDAAGNLLWAKDYPDRPDFVTLDTWDVGIDEYTIRVYYATLFPFARGPNHLASRLSPGEVIDFIEGEFVPLILDTWHTQFHVWGFGDLFHPDWDPDKIVEMIFIDPPFALMDGTGTYTVFAYTDGQPYPQRRLWLFSTNNAFQAYDTLANGYRAVFPHEFFHLAQWNVMLSAGCSTNKWLNVFIEAQGKFVPSVRYPEMELINNRVVGSDSEFIGVANRLLALRLNSSYRNLEADRTNKYDVALYWRFLFEQSTDMDIIRASLEEMACHFEPDIVSGIGKVMNRALERVDGPFRTFEESLIAFARANYALRLENGRCAAADPGACGGRYFDPKHRYLAPPLEAELTYDGSSLTYNGTIPASFGMDFLEVRLDPEVQGQPLTVRFQGEGDVARFNVQVWKLSRGETKPRSFTPQPEIVNQEVGGAHTYVIPQVDTTAYERLAFIVTRLDLDETADPIGSYDITLEPKG